ncbi:hypothetical protein CHS0354_015942 [Potamilus streckersoni]|uniref:Uncharacterized protein n=1 Tax=Potamilus streckersoni TaxID=2493646 RepID=A0AAE0W3Q4_9BIVA|nr:hypothetical protein CHS0354_015942 [Potamilus streckersoni]
MLLLWDMGCGRSKQRSPTSSNEDYHSEKESKKRKSKHGSAEKKENKDPSRKVSDKEINEISSQKLKSPGPIVNGSTQQTGNNEPTSPVFMDSFDGNGRLSSKSTQRDKSVIVNQKNIKITHSQIEFFKMLDEKIEKGRDFSDEDSLCETKST